MTATHPHEPTNAWNPAPSSTASGAPSPTIRSSLTDLVGSYRRPAFLVDPHGSVVAMSTQAEQSFDAGDGVNEADITSWPHHRLEVRTEDGTFYLLIPELTDDAAIDAQPRKVQLPPRLAKIARLVISGCTDKQIASRTGLSFSTVRTYVRQIYRRLGVHSRVELVHATSMGLTIE
ncbi:MAG: response regulator transcription factor [Myxococcales bacterium]|nr:response regulator transcription factor [Myxococcales bacterium]MCB9703472.1 response regulator transcription factor [Myxococcales bacterium]